MDSLEKTLSSMMLSLDLLEANGRIDGQEGKARDQGWYDLCKEMGMNAFAHPAYRTAYENGWHDGWMQLNSKGV